VVYIGSVDSKLYAYNAQSGALLWSVVTGDVINASPAVANGVAYIGSEDGVIYAYNASNGASLWTATTGDYIIASPTVADGMVYVTSADGKLYAYALNAGNNAVYKMRTTEPPSFSTLHPDFRLKPAAP